MHPNYFVMVWLLEKHVNDVSNSLQIKRKCSSFCQTYVFPKTPCLITRSNLGIKVSNEDHLMIEEDSCYDSIYLVVKIIDLLITSKNGWVMTIHKIVFKVHRYYSWCNYWLLLEEIKKIWQDLFYNKVYTRLVRFIQKNMYAPPTSSSWEVLEKWVSLRAIKSMLHKAVFSYFSVFPTILTAGCLVYHDQAYFYIYNFKNILQIQQKKVNM